MRTVLSCSLIMWETLTGASPCSHLCKIGLFLLSPSRASRCLRLFRLLDFTPVAALLAPSVEGVATTLSRYMQELGKNQEINVSPYPLPTNLVAGITTSAPLQSLSQRDANILTNLCHSIRDLEEVTRTSQGREALARHLGPDVANNIIEFWEEEWMV